MRRPLPVLLLPVAALLAGCTAPAPPVATPSSPPAPSSTSGPVITPVAEPTPLPSEVARAVISGSTVSSTTGDLPAGTRSVYVHLACSGPVGTAMHYELRDRSGALFGPSGQVDCTGEESTAGSSGTGRWPAVAQVVVGAPEGVTGYAVLSTSSER